MQYSIHVLQMALVLGVANVRHFSARQVEPVRSVVKFWCVWRNSGACGVWIRSSAEIDQWIINFQ